MHKNTYTLSLLLHQHPHPAFGVDGKQLVPVSTNQIIPKHRKGFKSNDSWRVSNLDRNREQDDTNVDILDPYDRRIKSYDRLDKKRKRIIKKKDPTKNIEYIKSLSNDENEIRI